MEGLIAQLVCVEREAHIQFYNAKFKLLLVCDEINIISKK